MLWQRIAVIIALVCATPCEGMAPGVQKLAPDFRSMSLAAKEDFVRRQVRAVKHARRLARTSPSYSDSGRMAKN